MFRIFTRIAIMFAIVAASVATASAQNYGNLPQGSYQQSCVNASIRGSVLSASCTSPSGQHVNSSLDVSRCTGSGTDIGNVNGYLACNGSNGYNNNGYNNGYNNNGYNNSGYNNGNNGYNSNRYNGRGNRALPGGSYLQTCSNARVRGSQLTANCMNNYGSRVAASINLNQCGSNADIGNVNGRLRCVYNR